MDAHIMSVQLGDGEITTPIIYYGLMVNFANQLSINFLVTDN